MRVIHRCDKSLWHPYVKGTLCYYVNALLCHWVIVSIGYCNITLKQEYNPALTPWWDILSLHCHIKSIGIPMNPERFVFSCPLVSSYVTVSAIYRSAGGA